MEAALCVRECDSADPALIMISKDAPPAWHRPVMVEAVLRYLQPHPGATIVDGTVGTGGHSLALLTPLLPNGRLIAIDRDQVSLGMARERLREFEPHVTFIHENYRNLPTVLKRLDMTRVDGLLLDLGMSSAQVDRAERGFSFSKEGPLDMRMDETQATTAETLIKQLTVEELTQLLQTLGEERFARRIAHRIVQARRVRLMTTTSQLADIITEAVPPAARHGRLHPATRAFQALRMAVNDELGALDEFLGYLPDLLAAGARAVIISFHSLEDRLVKRAFAQGARSGTWRLLTPKPLRPTEDEVKDNPRARSAKLRAVEKL